VSTLQLYRFFALDLAGGTAAGDVGMMDYLSDVIKCTLHTSAYTPAPTTDKAFATATNELTTANGYTAGGVTIAGKSIAAGATSIFDMDDTTVTWTASGGSLVFQYAVFHDDTVTVGPPIKPLIGYIDCGAQTITTGNTFTITTGANGLFTCVTTGA
jgi:hypothetical protein